MKTEMIKIHTTNGAEMHLNPRYIVSFTDHHIVVDDYAYNPDLKMPELKHGIDVFETAIEIRQMIDGQIGLDELDGKYADAFEKAKEVHAERFPF